MTLVATGPLTNVALLLALHPEARPGRIVLMGGAIAGGNVTPAEFNIWADPEAARRVFASGLDVTMVGLDVTHRALMRREHADELRGSGPVGRFVAELWDFSSTFRRGSDGAADECPVHDAVAMAHVLRPEFLATPHLNVEIDCESTLCRGRTVVDVSGWTGRPPNAHVGVEVDGEAFAALLVERIASLDEGAGDRSPG